MTAAASPEWILRNQVSFMEKSEWAKYLVGCFEEKLRLLWERKKVVSDRFCRGLGVKKHPISEAGVTQL